MSLTLPETVSALRAIREAAGYGNYQQAVKILNRERVNPERGKKEDFTWAQVKIAYRHQRGVCPVCNKDMSLIREKLHGDHWDCNLTVEEGLNSQKNCAAAHKTCNLHKGTKTPADLSKLRQLNPTLGEEDVFPDPASVEDIHPRKQMAIIIEHTE